MSATRRLLSLLSLAWLLCFTGLAGAFDNSIALADLPAEARTTLQLIEAGGPFPFQRDGVVFGNYEKHLPLKKRGYYREYTVVTPGLKHRGPRRIVAGHEGERYYTADHYNSFRRIIQ
ncbi:MAG TPA: ribonuclease domain-containing protein [Rhodocyclaceae bacterium]|nr:ribonuclease domain-containing protein [Rhodocyclaceae bacterium]